MAHVKYEQLREHFARLALRPLSTMGMMHLYGLRLWHRACNTQELYEVAVIDEIQMMADPRRDIVKKICQDTGDELCEQHYESITIAGRAGRRGCLYPDGLATTLHLDDFDYLIECLKQPFDNVKRVGLFRFYEQVELFAGQLPDLSFKQILGKFGENCRLDGSYFLCHHDHIKKIANMLEKVHGLSLENRCNFCFAPVNVRDPKAMYHLLRDATSFGQKLPVNVAMGMPKSSARNDSELLDLEIRHRVLSMYLWLSNHFDEETFSYAKKVEATPSCIC
ncbi:hypothetical protein Fmac_020765 [Flemingia macrophylla]|uniref:RNA helicase n=1 Tax=Flemingia macrophylla TaxID=520843 RepID=A0ABD1LV09_9FABA